MRIMLPGQIMRLSPLSWAGKIMFLLSQTRSRKAHGTPFATWAAAPIAGFRWLSDTSSLASYRSSERGHREFCRICGSVAPMVEESFGMVIAPAGNLEGDPGIRPTKHMFVGSKAGWYEITDDLPQHEEYPPEFGMPSTPRAPVELKPGVTQGSCLCGEVAYEITTPPLRMFLCHCSRCRQGRSQGGDRQRRAQRLRRDLQQELHQCPQQATVGIEHVVEIEQQGRDQERHQDDAEDREDEAEEAVAHLGQLAAAQTRDPLTRELVGAARRAIEAPDDVHRCRLAGAGGAHDRHELTCRDL
jgi:hypothetical protein